MTHDGTHPEDSFRAARVAGVRQAALRVVRLVLYEYLLAGISVHGSPLSLCSLSVHR